MAYRLYTPADWAKDGERRRKAGVPEDISFKTKPEIALEQLRWACEGRIGLRGQPVADAMRLEVSLFFKNRPTERYEMFRRGLVAWAMNLMLINVSTRKFRRAVRLPEGDVPAPAGSGVSKSAASRHFVALTAARMKEWMAADLSKLDLLVVQIDGIHMTGDLVLVAAIGIDGNGVKYPLGLIEGATENAAVVQALIDNLVGRGLDPAVPRLFIIDGSKALSKAIRRSFGREALIQRCQIHKARNIMERLPKPMHAAVRRVLRQAWELDDADKAEKLIRNLARRLEHDAPGVSASILEGLDEILTVTRLGRVTSTSAASASQCSTKSGTSPPEMRQLAYLV